MVNVSQQDSTLLLSGRLTQTDVAQLWPKRHQVFTAEILVVDLSALEYADSAGIALLVSLLSSTSNPSRSASATLTLVNPSPQLQKMIALYDLDMFFTTQ